MNKNSINWVDNKVFNTPTRQRGAPSAGRAAMKNASYSANTAPRGYNGQKDAMALDEMMPMQRMTPPGAIRQGLTQQEMTQQGPPTMTEPYYIPNYLARNIGRNVKAEFVLGTSQFMDKTGILREVGVNYFVLEDYISHALIMCDLYSVKFVTTL